MSEGIFRAFFSGVVGCLLGHSAPNPLLKGADHRLTSLAEKSLLFDDEVSAGVGCEAVGPKVRRLPIREIREIRG